VWHEKSTAGLILFDMNIIPVMILIEAKLGFAFKICFTKELFILFYRFYNGKG
jgi:hypothetical protein